MKIHIYSVMRNEEDLLPYFLRHYCTFADTIFILDDHSTDRTVEIAKKNKKVRLINFNYKGGMTDDFDLSNAFEESYKKYSRGVADWVMTVDADEFMYNKNMVKILKQQQKLGTKAIQATAYTMFSEEFPKTTGQIYKECFWGQRSRAYDKMVIFDPSLDVSLGMGRHTTKLPKNIKSSRANILMLHFRYLSRNMIIKRFSSPNFSYSNKKLINKITIALERHELGVRTIKDDLALKVV